MSETENDYYFEGYGSGNTKRGVLFDRHGDRISLALMGGDVNRRDDSSRELNTRRNGSYFRFDDYTLGLSGYHDDFKERKAFDMRLRREKRRAAAKQGLLLGWALGFALKGR